MTETLDNVIAQWTRLGAAFDAQPASESPDLEVLLLETARLASQDERVFVIAATWLCKYGHLVAKHRLKRLVAVELEGRYKPVLGLLLDAVRQASGTAHFNAVIGECVPAPEAAPLFDIERKHEGLRHSAERHASPISRRWNLWTRSLRPKDDALRPTRWIIRNNPEYRTRADFNGDLRSSIIAALRREPVAGASERSLARACGATRPAVRSSLVMLERAGRVERRYVGKRRSIVLVATPD
jgi:hypothetical protein